MLTFQRDKLSDCFDKAAKISGRKTAKDVTQWVLLEAEDGLATITATDLETGIRMSCPCKGPSLRVLLHGQLVAGFLKTLGDEVTLDLGEDKAVLSDRTTTFRPPVRDPDRFPKWQSPANSARLDAPRFTPAVNRTAWAADKVSGRFALAGVQVRLSKGQCELAATDSRCIAIEKFPADVNADWSGIIPTDAIEAAAPLMGGTFEFRHDDNAVEFEGVDSSYYTRLLQGNFPPKYHDVIPMGKFKSELVLACGDLARSVAQALMVIEGEDFTDESKDSDIADDRSRGAQFTVRDRTLVVECRSLSRGEFRSILPVAFDGETGCTIFPTLMRGFLGGLGADAKLNWGLEPTSANRFTVDGLDWVAVIMPLVRE